MYVPINTIQPLIENFLFIFIRKPDIKQLFQLLRSIVIQHDAFCHAKIVALIRHLHISHNAWFAPRPPPPKFFKALVFHFSWVLQPSQEKLKTMLMQKFGGEGRGGANKVHYWRCASGEWRRWKQWCQQRFSYWLIGSLSNHDGNGNENVTWKASWNFSNFITLVPFHTICLMLGNSSGFDSKGLYLSSER